MSTFWNYLRTFEPAILRSVVVALITLAGAFGVSVITDYSEQILATVSVVIVFISALQAIWTRSAVVPVAKHDIAVIDALYTPVPEHVVDEPLDEGQTYLTTEGLEH